MKKRTNSKKPVERHYGVAFAEALEAIACAGYPRPGTTEGRVSYVLKHDRQGNLTGVDVHVTDHALGEVLDCLTTEVE